MDRVFFFCLFDLIDVNLTTHARFDFVLFAEAYAMYCRAVFTKSGRRKVLFPLGSVFTKSGRKALFGKRAM